MFVLKMKWTKEEAWKEGGPEENLNGIKQTQERDWWPVDLSQRGQAGIRLNLLKRAGRYID
jgi:hypothetical protein